MKAAILGNGGFGTAMALSLARAGHAVSLWGHDPVYTTAIAASRRNPRYLDGVVLPDAIRVSHDATAVLDRCELVLVAVPTQHVRGVMTQVAAVVPSTVPLVSLAKGLEQSTGRRPTEILSEVVGRPERVFALSGPSHAEEIARELPTTVVVAGTDDTALQALQVALQTKTFRVYRNRDVLGIEICGALKNVMALAAGIADGLGYGDNAKAAILTRGLVEMQRYGLACGADPRTFFGLAGVGDLAVTAFSRHGRNRAFGERIGRGETLEQALRASPKVAEGVWTSKVVVAEGARLGVEMPIATAVARVLFDGMSGQDAVRALMERDPKAEA
ncbi:MAG: NAD(P)-dependent glycerol-3-phosphate dehydrogenase [Planctomycetes bacterium]|nr:NAD(P)-dependent glycerol-3-phosphate dehydrogenase [Planctomycetota bacterium]